ncbi:AtpZ/AtpI family protein [Athalassotoga saccharophila]|uniref:AtpZ/AtpI family protein n=1 Tax=Athalassotoga saccharophila TaxID=1441386 RepID=UPI00137B5282|nr:AtpZ/AtpI family protein [Athalassotoga saccharophila]BBJ27835.1 ATP synthase protein I [Athalassotoga saccharophila]
MDQDRNGKRSRELVNLFKSANIVTSFSAIVIANIAVGGFLGYYIDKWTFNNKIIFIILLFLGIISGIYNGIKYLLKEVEKSDGKSKKD